MQRIEVPYLVVGAGPVGLMAGILLGNQRRKTWVIERKETPQTAPAAHVVNARTFEICRQAGVDMDAIAHASKHPEDAGHVYFMTRLTGQEVGRLPFERQGDDMLDVTPTPLRNLSQHRFEPILADALEKLPSAELRYGHEWEESAEDEDGVTSIIRDVATGERFEVRSKFVIACDGAGSRVRKQLAIEMDGPASLQHFLMLHVGANLREIVKDRPGVLYFLVDPANGGCLVAHDIDREWVFMHHYDPAKETEADFDEARCLSLVRNAVGQDVPMELLHKGTWNMSAQTAQHLRSDKSNGSGRIFLAGDAAHRFPPTGGMGLNTGIQDVHNLVWKLCAVEDGQAGEPLLDTYETERLPVARNNATQSLKNALAMAQLGQALGLDTELTTERLETSLADPARRQAIAEAVANQAEHFDMLGLQLGFAYAEGAIVPDGTAPPEVDNPVREYIPSTRPGARLPHAWVDHEGERVSTLDLVHTDGLTVLTGEDSRVEEDGLHVVRLEADACRACGIDPGGALVVRPDQHVAWRGALRTEQDAASLRAGLARAGLHAPSR